MLVLSRKLGEIVKIGDNIEVQVLEAQNGRVKLGFVAPKHVSIHRLELFEKLQTTKAKSDEDKE